MNRRSWLQGILVVGLVVSGASPAAAQDGFWRWFEKLSGPGPYQGWGVNIVPACVGVPTDPLTYEDTGEADRVFFFDLSCVRASRNELRLMIGLELASLRASDNELEYAPPRAGRELETRAFLFMPTVDVGVRRWLDVGAGIGFMRFSGSAFEPFSKPAVQALRASVKPFVFLGGDARRLIGLEFLQLRYILTVVPDGFTAQEFGAVPGTFSTDTEFLNSFSVVVNLMSLVELLRR